MRACGKVYLIGAGPGDPELLTLKALRMLKKADVVVYDRLVSDEIMALCPPQSEKVAVGKSPDCHPVPQDQINKILLEQALKGRTVARLKGGDPMIFGRGSEEMLELALHGVSVEICPGITAAQGAVASAGIALTHRGLASGVRYVTGHRARNNPLDLDWEGMADPETTLVVYMGVANISLISERLIAAGLEVGLPVMVVSNATQPNETTLLSNLYQIGAHARAAKLSGPTLFIIGRVVSLHADLRQILRNSEVILEPEQALA